MDRFMKLANENAKRGIKNGDGGPFGAIILDENLNIIANGNNKVLKNNDPTAHAEIVAIREACKKLNTYDLSKCILYTSCEPCPMCLSAIIWANIKTVYYGCTKEDAGEIGFRDDIIYDYLKGKNTKLINLKQLDRNTIFITQLKKNIANWDVIVILLLKQSKRYNVKTRNHLIDKISKSISEELIMIQTIEKLF